MRIIFLILAISLANILQAQVKNQRIVVRDAETGLPLSNVTIRYGKQATATDHLGMFELTGRVEADSISFSHLLYERLAVPMDRLSSMKTISLKQRSNMIDEILIHTGYQKINPRLSTGAVDKIDISRSDAVYGTVLQKLEGNSSIVFDKNSSRPGMTIRGLSSINNNSLPLVVLDNFPFEGDLDLINPEDIADITILKDAAASAIWGTRAGNGVIVLTTKKGSYNTPIKISLASGTQIQKVPDLYYHDQISSSSVVDLEKFLFENGYYKNQERSASKLWLSPVVEHLISLRDGNGSPEEHLSAIENLRSLDVRRDYEKYIYGTSLNQNHNLSLSGGGTSTRFLLSGRFDNNRSVLGSSESKMVLRSFVEMKPFKDLNISTDVQYFDTKFKEGKSGYSLIATRPYMLLADNNGAPLPHAKYRSAYLDTAGNGLLEDWYSYPLTSHQDEDFNTSGSMVTANLSIDYRLHKIVKLIGNYRFERSFRERNRLNGGNGYFVRDLVNRYTDIDRETGEISYGIPRGGILDQERTDASGHNFRLGAELDHSWRSFQLSALIGLEVRQLIDQGTTDRFYGFDPENYGNAMVDYIHPHKNFINGAALYVPFVDRRFRSVNRFVSQYLNASLSYQNRHILTGSVRRDASNLFGVRTNEKWQPLWSIGYRWNATEGKISGIDWISDLNLRVSYGVNGNVDQSRSAITTIKYSGPDFFTNSSTAFISQYANPELRWERTKIGNIGVDFSFLASKIGGSIDYYHKKGEDLFGISPIDYTAVPSKGVMRNVASMEGSGVDLKLYANDLHILPGLKFSPHFMLNFNRSRITHYYLSGTTADEFLSNGTSVSGMVGFPVYSVFVYPSPGLDGEGNPVGVLGEGESIDYTGIRNQGKEALEFGGSAVPPISGFFNPKFNMGKFELAAGLSFKFGYVFKRQTVRYGELVSMGALGAGSGDFERRWQKPGDENHTTVPSFVYPMDRYRNQFYENSSVLIENGDHIRVQNVTISYGFMLSDRINAKLNINGTNLGLIWKANKRDIDPDYVSQFRPRKLISVGIKLNY